MAKMAAGLVTILLLATPHSHGETLDYTLLSGPEDLLFSRENGYDVVDLSGVLWNVRDVGHPRVPVPTIDLLGPPDTRVVGVEVTEAESTVIGQFLLCPVQARDPTSLEPPPQWVGPDSETYSSSNTYPGKLAEVVHEGYLDQAHIVRVSVYPLQWNPLTRRLVLYHSIAFRILFGPQERFSRLAVTGRGRQAQKVYDLALRGILRNPGDLPRWYQEPPGTAERQPRPDPDSSWTPEYLVITGQGMAAAFEPLRLWKKKRGIPAEIVTVEEILRANPGPDAGETIRNYLTRCYQSSGTCWVLLGGDNEAIPWRYVWNEGESYCPPDTFWSSSIPPTDLYYADLTGDWDLDEDRRWGEPSGGPGHPAEGDCFPELFVGRVPCRTPAEAENYVRKALCYEQRPETIHLCHHLGLEEDEMQEAQQLERDSADFFPRHIQHHLWRELPACTSRCPWFPRGQDFISELSDSGYGFVTLYNHGGHWGQRLSSALLNSWPGWGEACILGDDTTWGSSYSVEDSVYARGYIEGEGNGLENLANDGAYPVVYCIGCKAAGLDVPFQPQNTACEGFLTCFPERGAIAFLGNTRDGSVHLSYGLHQQFLACLFDSAGGYHVGVAEAVSRCTFPDRDLILNHNAFADPELPIWIRPPETMEVDHVLQIPAGHVAEVAVTARAIGPPSPGQPVDSAWVCLYRPGEFWQHSITDTAGRAEFTVRTSAPGAIHVTVSKPPAYLPSQTVIRVVDCRERELLDQTRATLSPSGPTAK